MSISTNQFKNGTHVEVDGVIYRIMEFQHVKPGKGGAFVRTKLKNLKTGAVLEHTFRSGDKVDKPDLEDRDMQFMYRMENSYHFMDTASYEQIYLDADHVGDAGNYLIENLPVKILFYRGEPIGIDLPILKALSGSDARRSCPICRAFRARKGCEVRSSHVRSLPSSKSRAYTSITSIMNTNRFESLSRLSNEDLLARVSHTRMLLASAFAAVLGCVILLATDNQFGAISAILLVGAGFAPIYPLVVEKIGGRFSYYHPGFFNGIFSFALTGGMIATWSLGLFANLWGIGVVMVLPLLGTVTFNDEAEQHLILAVLRPGNSAAKLGAIGRLRGLFRQLRAAFPGARLRVRLDGGFAGEDILGFLEAEGVEYLVALGSNSRLEKRVRRLLGRARVRAQASGATAHLFGETRYAAKKWTRKRRIIMKAEVLCYPGRPRKDNPRFLVTNLRQRPATVYAHIYCGRGDMENRLKELQHGLAMDRTSCSRFAANQFRLLLSLAAYALFQTVQIAARRTGFGAAQVETLRAQLVKLAVWVERSVRRIVLHLPATFAWRDRWCDLAHALAAT